MKQPLWVPSEARRRAANLTRFIDFVNRKHGLRVRSYRELWEWSVAQIPEFWTAVWDFAGIVASHGYDQVVDDLSRFPGARWFEGARLNFAENLLRRRDQHTAFVFRGEAQRAVRMSYAELYDAVARVATSLREMGVQPGDRVVAYMPNLIETAAAMLATASIGAVWASCATDLGPAAAVDRLGQVAPKVLFTVDGYYYKGQAIDTHENAAALARGIPSLTRVIVVPYGAAHSDLTTIPRAVRYDDVLERGTPERMRFEQLPFDHPVFIMFSSGTTGKPKCLVQGAGGVLLNHLKEQLLHTDLTPVDKITYLTTCSWMMWNWLLSSLAVGATVLLYDGHPSYPDPSAMWQWIADEGITIFGCSASYLNAQRSQGIRPASLADLSSLREISQTGRPSPRKGFSTCTGTSKPICTSTLSPGAPT